MHIQSNVFAEERTDEVRIFSAPLGDLQKGRLEIANGASNFELTGDSQPKDLFHAQFSGVIPEVHTRNERVLIRYRRSAVRWFLHELLGGRQDGKVRLNSSVPWQIDIRGGVSRLDADLRDLQLRSLSITGGVSGTDIFLPPPRETVRIHVASGVSNLRIFHPRRASVRLKVGGGISHLVFDDQSYGSMGGGLQLETAEYKAEADRYEIVISGGVSNLIVGRQS